MLDHAEAKSLMKAVGEAILRHVSAVTGPIFDRLVVLERAVAERPDRGEKGDPGANGVTGEKGDPGPQGEPGARGDVGPAGADGIDGKSFTVDDVRPIVESAMDEFAAKALAFMEAVPPAKDGVDGKDGRDGSDGKSVTLDEVMPLLNAKMAEFALDLERRAQDILQRSIDRMPIPKDGRDGRDGVDGKDGVDAFELDDLEVEQDEDGRVTLRFIRADERKEVVLRFPVFVDRGVFKADEVYERGNGVTWAGSLWLAQKDAPAGKPGENADWRLAVKKGRDGKDGERGDRGDKGDPGQSWVKTDDLNGR